MSKQGNNIPQNYKISEFAAMVGMSQSKVRYYEKAGLFSGYRSENGYRYYLPQDAFRANAFRMLLQYGFTVEQAIRMLDEKQRGEVFLKSLQEQEEELRHQADLIQYRQKRLHYIIDLIQTAPGEKFEIADIEDWIYVRASYGRDFRVSVENAEELAEFVDVLSISSFARVIALSDLMSEADTIDPSYVHLMPETERFRLKCANSPRIERLPMGKCLRYQREKTRAESEKKETFAPMFAWLKEHGYHVRGDILLMPAFLNLDGQGKDWETLLVPIE